MDVSDNPPPGCTQVPKRGLAGALLIIGGTLCVSLGFIGMFVPILPTTPFLLLAAVCYARSSQRFYMWLLTNRWCGQYIRRYREGKGVPLRQKVLAITLLWITIGYAAGFVVSVWWLKAVLMAIAVGVTVHLVKVKTFRPEEDNPRKTEGDDPPGTTDAVRCEGQSDCIKTGGTTHD